MNSERDPNLEMSPRAFAIGMTALAIYFAFAFRLTFYMLSYNPTFALRSATLVRDPVPAVSVEIEWKERREDLRLTGELAVWFDDGPPYHFQEYYVGPGAPGTKQVVVVPLDDVNRTRLERGARGRLRVRFYSGHGRSVKMDVRAP